MHAETTSEKQSMGYFCDGRASLVVGTHTHAPTADLRLLPAGTAFMSDVGMTGDYDSGNRDEQRGAAAAIYPPRSAIGAFRSRDGGGDVVRGVWWKPGRKTGLASRVAAVRVGGCLQQAEPAFWP